MINQSLIFTNKNNIAIDVNLDEKIVGMDHGLLPIGIGKTVTIEKISDDNKTLFMETSIQTRKTPPLGLNDTSFFSRSARKSVHEGGELFSDSEIVKKLDTIKKVKIGSKIYVFYTNNEKAIIQQQATRGCSAATAAMLIMDNGKKPDLLALRKRNLGDDVDQVRDIQNAGLKAIINSANDLLALRNLIIQNDSCIVSISGSLGGHVIVVDKVSKNLSKIRLRDPYHGWEITVSSEAFLKEWHGGKVIQIAKAKIEA